MKTLLIAAVVLLAFGSVPASAADGVRCGPTGQFYGYGFRARSTPCWVLEAYDRGAAGGQTASE